MLEKLTFIKDRTDKHLIYLIILNVIRTKPYTHQKFVKKSLNKYPKIFYSRFNTENHTFYKVYTSIGLDS